MRRKTYQKGFTLVELALSMVFVGILSIAVALIISDTVASYKRGLTLNQINTVGMDLVDDMRTAVQNSSSRVATSSCYTYYGSQSGAYSSGGTVNTNSNLGRCIDDGAYNFVYLVKRASVTINGTTESDVPIYGAFCTGSYSYIWNSGYFESEDATFTAKENKAWAKLIADYGGGAKVFYKTSRDAGWYTNYTGSLPTPDGDDKPFRLLKVRDDYRAVCVGVTRTAESTGAGSYTYAADYHRKDGTLGDDFNGVFSMLGYQSLGNDLPVDLIVTDKANDLAIYDLYTPKPAESSTQKNAFYSTSFILGTVGGGINILAQGKSCAAPSDYTIENFDYCAINKFSFAVQAGRQ